MKLSAKQRRVMRWLGESPGVACLVGTVRSGKSHIAALAFATMVCAFSPVGSKHVLGGRKKKVLDVEVVPHLRRMAGVLKVPFLHRRYLGEIAMAGRTIHLAAGNDARSLENVQGLTVHSMMVDEATLLPETFFNPLMSRLSYEDSRAIITCNPSRPSHYIKRRWIDEGKVDLHLDFTFEDNPVLAESVKARYRKHFSGVFAKRMVDGLWCSADGLIWPDWTQWTPGPDWTLLRVDIGVDYGTASTTAFQALETWQRRHPAERRYRLSAGLEVAGGPDMRNAPDGELVEALQGFMDGLPRKPRSIVLDPSAASFRAALLKLSGRRFAVRRGRNDVNEGLRRVGAALADGSLSIGPENDLLQTEVEGYGWSPDEGKEEPIKEADHHCDAARYVSMDHLPRRAMTAPALPEGF